jgi:hypothetical protein
MSVGLRCRPLEVPALAICCKIVRNLISNGVASRAAQRVQGLEASSLWSRAISAEEKRQGAGGRRSNPRDARSCADLCKLRLRQAMPPIDSPEQRKAQRDEAERINQLIRRRRPADEQPVDESNVDAGDATDAVPPQNKKGPSGGSRVKSGDIGFGEDEARASCPKLPGKSAFVPHDPHSRTRTPSPLAPAPRRAKPSTRRACPRLCRRACLVRARARALAEPTRTGL